VVDRTLILRKLAELEEYHRQMKEYAGIALEQYSQDWKIQRIVERTLQMMIETCVDIAGHIISDQRYRVPTSYGDSFRVLLENNIVGKALFEKLEKMARFRNLIVHHYEHIDPEIVLGILKRNLDDFLEFKDSIVTFLTRS
jgi:uncharacterized protein YutE (UPF0331/DUF86 family)